jgi:hypothetical protein
MQRVDDRLSREDLELLHEAFAYMRKRVFDQAELVRIKGIAGRLEELLLAPPEDPAVLRLSPPEQETFGRQVASYCAELTRRGSSAEGREQAARLERIAANFGRPPVARGWLRRLFGR